MINSLSSRLKSFVSSSKSNETDVTYHRKRKRENDERDQSDGEVEFVAEKKPKLERTSSQSSLFGGVLTTATLQNMSDWVQHKIPSFNMFSWKSKSSKPTVSHGNGQGLHGHGHQGQRGKPDRAGVVSVSRPSQNLHRDALRTSYDNRGSLPSGSSYQSNQPPGPGSHQSSQPPGQGSYQSSQPPGLYQSSQPPGSFQSGMVNGEESEQPLTRPSIHESGSHALRKPPGSISGSSVAGSEAGSSIGSRKGLSRLYGRIFHTKQKEKFTATESVRLDDKVRYKELLQQFTTIPLEQETTSQRPENVKHPVRVPQLTRFYFKSNDSILGSTTSHSLKLPEKHDHTERPKIKVHPRERRTSHRPSSTQPVVNGDNLEDDSLMCVTDISAIHDIRGNNLPGSSKRISIDLTEDDDDVQIVSKHKPNASDYRESKFMTEDWIKDLTSQYNSKARERERQIVEEEIKAKLFDERRKAQDEDLEKRLRQQMQIYKREPAVTEELFDEEEEEEKEEELPELTDDMQEKISNWLRPGQQVLIEKFKLQITRNDIATLAGLNWLNDEIINFYMNLLVERGEQDGNSKVYAFNTFFYPKILSGGQAAVKRWTRRVDVFAHDYILIPVHLGMHWCLAVVSFKKKQVQYYDSMGGNNVQCLNVIKKYLCDESIDKKKQEFNLQGWTTVVVKDIPQQMNGSDCGMFACKYAEYITRGAPITFTQQHMPYFRRRMVYEIVTGKLLQ